MSTPPFDLTAGIPSEARPSNEFYGGSEDGIAKALRLLVTPGLFAQPLFALTLRQGPGVLPECSAVAQHQLIRRSDLTSGSQTREYVLTAVHQN
jgi:hypothetical protein